MRLTSNKFTLGRLPDRRTPIAHISHTCGVSTVARRFMGRSRKAPGQPLTGLAEYLYSREGAIDLCSCVGALVINNAGIIWAQRRVSAILGVDEIASVPTALRQLTLTLRPLPLAAPCSGDDGVVVVVLQPEQVVTMPVTDVCHRCLRSSTLALMPCARCGSSWYGYTTTPRIQIASKAAHLPCVAAHATHVETGEKELHRLHGSAGSRGERGGQRRPLCLSG